jgi:hypothetical protein
VDTVPKFGRALSSSLLLLISIPSAAQKPTPPNLKELERLLRDSKLDVAKAQSDPLGYGYDLFFYTNWPALLKRRGQPDRHKHFGDTGMVLWETWKNSAETFRRCGLTPDGWEKPEPVPQAVRSKPQQPSDSGKSWQNMTGNTQVDGFNLKDRQDRDILYQIRQNQSTFDYIVEHKLFSIDGQVAFAAATGNQNFNFDSIEVKTAWTWLDPTNTTPVCRAENYFTTNAYFQTLDNNGKPAGYQTGLMALTGIHIITKALPQWVWITFEQINNETCIGSRRAIPIGADVVAENRKMQPLLQGKWANYMMVGVQTEVGTPQQPIVLANTQIEYAFQPRSSCMTCHAIASVASHFPVKPEDNLRMSYVNLTSSPPYFIGPAPSLGSFKSMDFLWSLEHAYRLNTADPTCRQ